MIFDDEWMKRINGKKNVVFHWKNDHKWLFSAIISLLFFHLKNGSILSRVWRDTCVCDWKFKNSLCIAAVVPRFIYKSMISVSNLYIKQSNQNSTYKKKKIINHFIDLQINNIQIPKQNVQSMCFKTDRFFGFLNIFEII